jgi:hypothetical protein
VSLYFFDHMPSEQVGQSWRLVALNKIHLPSEKGHTLGYLGRWYNLREKHVGPSSHCFIWLCYTASDLALADKKTKFESSTVHAL